VVDDLLGVGEHTARLGWLADGSGRCAPAAWAFAERLRADIWFISLAVRGAETRGELAGDPTAGEAQVKGWEAWTYAERQPALRLEIESTGALPLRLITWFALDGAGTGAVDLEWNAPGDGVCALRRAALGAASLDLSRAHPADPSSLRRAR
jgi:hypothetical protein